MSSTKPISVVQSVVDELLAELHAKGGCEKVGLTREAFAVILGDIGSKHATASTSESEIRAFFLSLRIDELALARACAAGSNSAWEIFLTRFREKLYLSALRIAREDSAARELADTLYADLTEPARARANECRNFLPTRAGDRWRAGCAPWSRRNTSIVIGGPSAW